MCIGKGEAHYVLCPWMGNFELLVGSLSPFAKRKLGSPCYVRNESSKSNCGHLFVKQDWFAEVSMNSHFLRAQESRSNK